MKNKHLLIAPPPTPNGDLHVGHISGPYLAADIYRRFLSLHGETAFYTVSSDDNQTYVDTSASRKGMSPAELIAKSRQEIVATLDAYDIELSQFGGQDSDYEFKVLDWVEDLLAQGALEIRDIEVLYDAGTGEYPVESFLEGYCPTCFEGTAGGICESCGHPNNGINLLGLQGVYETVTEPRLVLDLEKFREELTAFLAEIQGVRPRLKALIDELLGRPLPVVPISYKTPRGIALRVLPGQRINVWAEMYLGHLHFLEQVAGPLDATDRYVQFLGFDNSFFYVFLHGALYLASQKAGQARPRVRAFVTNQFYNLDDFKFSTSKNHVIWGIDLAREYNSDLIRLYLTLCGPEYQECNFERPVFLEKIKGIAEKINGLARVYNEGRQRHSATGETAPIVQTIAAANAQPIDLENYSASTRAAMALKSISYLTKIADQAPAEIPALLQRLLFPYCPKYAQKIAEACGLPEPRWGGGIPGATEGSQLPFISLMP